MGEGCGCIRKRTGWGRQEAGEVAGGG
jgi:hypothetical protein